MHSLRRYAVILPLSAAISFLMVSCGESKSSQCKNIINVANQAVADSKTFTNGGQKTDPNTMLKAADAMDKAAKDMETIKVQDRQLKEHQTGFIKMYRDTSQAMRTFVAAYQKKDRAATDTALKRLQQATSPEKNLVSQINTYCASK